MEFLGLGGTDEVGASCYLYRLPEANLLIDAGLRPGMQGDASLPYLKLLQEKENTPTCMVLSHAHLDHVAALPVVTSMFRDLPVYCTAPTARILQEVLFDTLKITRSTGEMIFDSKMMKRALERIRVVQYFQHVTEHGFGFMLVPSGHLLGAASVAIECSAGKIFHTGDFSNVATVTTNAAYRPPQPIQQHVVVSESTYGDTNLPGRKEQVRNFVGGINETLRGGGKVLIPSFALGRAQEMVSILLSHMANNLLPTAPIYLDGMARSMTQVYEDLLPELPEALQNQVKNARLQPFLRSPVALVEDERHRESIIASRERSVIITSSGMLQAGPSPMYARGLLGDEKNGLFIVGYQDAESPGRRLLELQQGGEVMLPVGPKGGGKTAFEPVAAYCRVERFYLSAHADRMGIISQLTSYPSDKVILTHGEANARHALADHLKKEREVHLPKAGEVVEVLKAAPHLKRTSIVIPRKAVSANQTSETGGATTDAPRETRVKKFKEEVQGVFDAETNTLTLHFKDLKDPNFFPTGTYRVEGVRGSVTRVQITERWRGPKQVPAADSLSAMIARLSPYPVTLQEVINRGFSGSKLLAQKWLKQRMAEGTFVRLKRGVYTLSSESRQS
ncbi:MBL fold metallo-hydrolase [Deinococcus roseus]|uniref:MBL fold metallo-hydrolase n=1 Tax=Deinococcus roseus TaxID=392414 RepID=A0ABQ2D6M4_9DEIO|nr:MBL fold metallo-hydrolase [Deinococcus roseus]GGJ47952.1 hypothetical protein GCM10008938_37460 [Deinococcus roseus]